MTCFQPTLAQYLFALCLHPVAPSHQGSRAFTPVVLSWNALFDLPTALSSVCHLLEWSFIITDETPLLFTVPPHHSGASWNLVDFRSDPCYRFRTDWLPAALGKWTHSCGDGRILSPFSSHSGVSSHACIFSVVLTPSWWHQSFEAGSTDSFLGS